MDKIKFERSCNIKVICNSMDYDVKDFSSYYKGGGVYCFIISSRNEVDDIIKISDNNEFELSSKEELIKECMEDSDSIEEEYWDEYCGSGKMINGSDIDVYYEDIGEEVSREYYYIVE